jgi:WD40 repeat protein/serine/threonine protein kinase
MLEPASLDLSSASGTTSMDRALADIVDRIAARLRRGEPLDMEGEITQNPQCAAALRTLLPTLEALVVARQTARATDSSVAERRAAVLTPVVSQSESEAPEANPKSKIENPKLLGDFELVREVGRGGMGIVYEARQLSLGRRVAVKILPTASLLDARQLQRFQNEARAAAQLNHPHIVDVLCVGCHEGVHYFAMRFVEGRTLAEVIGEGATERGSEGENEGKREEGKDGVRSLSPSPHPSVSPSLRPSLSPSQKAEWIAQAAEALEHAHASGIVHRDVKPSNLLVDNDGKLWVTDFGVARCGDDAGLTLTGDLLGTLRYMSPEQALGRLSAIGPRSDVYSLGATLYELLVSRPVFAGDDRGELLRQVAFEQPVALRKLDPRLPCDLETIAHKALEKSPDDRYAAAGEMAADLRRFLRGEPIRAKPPTLAERATKWCLRHRRVAVTASALLLLAVVGLSASTLLIVRSRNDALAAQKLAEDRDRENRRMLSVIETGLAMQAYQQGDLARAKELLDRQASRTRENSGSEGRHQASGVRHQEGSVGNGLSAVPNGQDTPRTLEDGLPGPSRPTGDGLGRPSSADDFRGFAWHWLRQSIDARLPELKSFNGHPGEVYEVDYSPDGALLAAACDRRIVIHHAKSGEIVHDIAAHESGVTSLDFSPDGVFLASVSYDRRVRLWDGSSGDLAADLGEHDCDVASVAFSPDSRRLATGDDRGGVILWDIPQRREQRRLIGHEGKIDSLAFAADGRLVVISGDGHMTAWDANADQPLWRVRAPHTTFIPLAISPDLKTVATGDHGGIVGLWSLRDGAPLGSMGLRLRVMQGLAFARDGTTLASGGHEGMTQLWDARSRSFLGQTGQHGDRVWSVAFSPNGDVLATGSRDGSVKLWDVRNGRQPRHLATADAVVQLAFSASGHELAIACNGDLWRWRRGTDQPEPSTFQGMSTSPVVGWRGESLVVRDVKGDLWLHEPDGTSALWIRRQGAPPHQLVVSPDEHWLAVRGEDGRFELWDADRAELCAKLEGFNATPSFWPDSQSLLAARERRLLRWNLPLTSEPEQIFQLPPDVYYVACSPDGQTLALGYTDARLELANLTTGRRTPLVGHSLGVTCAAFSPDGGTLASGSSDGTLHLWSVATGQEYYTLERRTDGDIRTIVFSPDGRSLAAAGRDGPGGRVTLWELK